MTYEEYIGHVESEEYAELYDDYVAEWLKDNTSDLNLEVLSESLYDVTQAEYDTLSEFMSNKDWANFGRKIWAIYMDTAESRADTYAKEQISLHDL